ncbi:hypothetical protein chiPu_0027445, partial [Chiloscyllium punctatum]|nr:hypothetical protein [Chiloscyllium punctatum]
MGFYFRFHSLLCLFSHRIQVRQEIINKGPEGAAKERRAKRGNKERP